MPTTKTWWLMAGIVMFATNAWAHVPYLEGKDFTAAAPFKCPSATQSIAVYAWLEDYSDVDYYTVTVKKTLTFFADVIVPAFDVYADFRPSFALIGPGLPMPSDLLPVPLPKSCGAIVLHDADLNPRPQFYEPFGNKSYYQGPRLELKLKPGNYFLIYWDPKGQVGDYVAAIGKYEIWWFKDLLRAIFITPIIRAGGELHLPAE
ncbi:MAG: hypothetical protein ABFD81_08315 [Syntrophaceae bacterium]